jgi:hypothetical protein
MSNNEPLEEKRKRFHFSVTLGNILSILVITGGLITVYATSYSDNNVNKTEIANVKKTQTDHENADREARQDLKDRVSEVKQQVDRTNDKLDRVLQELLDQRRNNGKKNER